jgi:hypothetical protein
VPKPAADGGKKEKKDKGAGAAGEKKDKAAGAAADEEARIDMLDLRVGVITKVRVCVLCWEARGDVRMGVITVARVSGGKSVCEWEVDCFL